MEATSYHISHDSTKSEKACSVFPSCSVGSKYGAPFPFASGFIVMKVSLLVASYNSWEQNHTSAIFSPTSSNNASHGDEAI